MPSKGKKIRIVEVSLAERSYPIVIGSGVRRKFGELFRKHGQGRAFWVTDGHVADLWGKDLKADWGFPSANELLILSPGEEQKKLSTIETLCRALAARGVERGDTLVAWGGGVVGDIVGFAAACYLRGIAFVQVPTTLLAMVDSSVGGKTGVDLPEGKNLVGAFHQPRFVLIDVDSLRTLPQREFISGLAEVVKSAIIGDRELFNKLKRNANKCLKPETGFLCDVIQSSIAFKAAVVQRDEREQDLRRILNFGHTVGHALEALGNYRALKHGEAVFWGMSAAVELSRELDFLDTKTAAEIGDLLRAFLAAIPGLDFEPETALDFIARDKKVRRGIAHFVLLNDIARPLISNLVTREQLRAALGQVLVAMRKGGGT